MKGRWVKDSCPYARDQGFQSVVGNVAPGETVFGFTYLMTSASDTITLKTVTKGLVTQMADKQYRVIPMKVDTGSIADADIPRVSSKKEATFVLSAENAKYYDVIVVGRVLY
jgi:hypothetical protein